MSSTKLDLGSSLPGSVSFIGFLCSIETNKDYGQHMD